MTESAAAASAPEDPPNRTGKHPIAAHPVASAIITVLVLGTIVCTLVEPIYGSVSPKVGSWPFFYVYLLAFMPVVAIALWIAMLLQRRLAPAGGTTSTSASTEDGQ
ncbi:MAG: hypothetical protein FWE35_03065 [Streptosporangiales bacterium]|jgi:hypothetical protein|nr:hypothetical protein [Streptosporangiales bacterium]